MEIGNVTSVLADILGAGRQRLSGNRQAAEIAEPGGAFGDAEYDTELKGDKDLGRFYAEQLIEKFTNIGRVTVEGLGELPGNPGGTWWATVDPIDGSLNFKDRGHMNGFPHTSCITILKDGDRTTFDDVLYGGIIDLRPDISDIWLTERQAEGYRTWCGRGRYRLQEARVLPHQELNLGGMNVIGEMYYPENRDELVRAFGRRERNGVAYQPQKGWLRSIGSAAYEMASVASGQAVAFVCGTQKQHELGAAYALVKGAGGVAVDWNGEDLGGRSYSFVVQTPVILAANRQIADQILELLRRD